MGKTLKIEALALGLIAGGLTTWIEPYRELLVWGMDYRALMALATLILSFSFKRIFKSDTVQTSLFIGLGVISSLVIRIIYDRIFNVAAHDLWPMELALFALVAFFSTFIGTYLGELITWTRKNRA